MKLAATLAAALLLAAPAAAEPMTLNWSVSPARDAGRVQFALRYERPGHQHHNSRTVTLSELSGLDAATLGGRGGPVRFERRAEAGLLACSGSAGSGHGGGTCRFTPDPAFADALAQRGIGRPSTEQAYQLASANVGIGLLDALERHGVARPDMDDLVAAGIHGVTPDYVAGMAAAGYRTRDMGGLVAFRTHGVTPDFVRDLVAASPRLANLPADQLLAMRIHGVRPDYVRELAALGYSDLSSDQLVAMRIHGVTPAFVRAMQADGYRPASANALVSARITGQRPIRAR